ncbi:MAG: family 20 glycosylhydrolase [Verrucomicrobiales bacterium]
MNIELATDRGFMHKIDLVISRFMQIPMLHNSARTRLHPVEARAYARQDNPTMIIRTLLLSAGIAILPMQAPAQVLQGPAEFLPVPQSLESRSGTMLLNKGSRIAVSDDSVLPLGKVLAGELEAITGLTETNVTVGGNKGHIFLVIDPALDGESYSLDIDEKAVVRGGNYQALAAGTASLLQALMTGESGDVGLAKVKIADHPDTAYRGLMVDVARQWHRPETLREIIQLCRLYKIRYLQLHLTDDQSWTVPLKKYPQIATPKRSYTEEALRDLVAYADRRGVTLIPEIDMPAHSSAICNAMPELFRSPNGGIINFASEDAVTAMGDILDEVCSIFSSSPYVHLGADEANLRGLDRNPQFKAAITRHGVDGVGGLFNHFLNRMNERVQAHGKTSIAWEGFHLAQGANQLDPSFIVMPFDNYRSAESYYIKGGHRVINTSWYPLYVVGQRPLTEFVYDWDLYTFGNFTDPFPRRTTSVKTYEVTSKDKVLGAQMCSWEQAGDSEMRQLRHPLPAMAERIWNRNVKDFEGFQRRLARTDQILNALLTKERPSPVDANASDSVYAEGVMIRWKAGDNYTTHYTVLRSTGDSINSAEPIASKVTTLEFFDQTAVAGQKYYYWIKAGNKLGGADPGKGAPGSAGTTTKITRAYEGFDYPDGEPLVGQNGGRGWESAWELKTEGPATIKKTGLTYEGLQTSGGCVNVKMNMKSPEEKTLHLGRSTKVAMGQAGTDFWMSFLLRANRLGEGHCFLKNIGKAWVNGLGVHTRNSGHPIKEGETVLLVAHFACLEGNDTIRMWVNPTLGKTPPADSHDMAYCDAVDIGISKDVLLNVQPHGNGDYDIDEIRIGQSWDEVIALQSTPSP